MPYLINYPNDVENAFHFLIKDFGYKISEKEEYIIGYKIIYERGLLKIILNYDYKDNFFYFWIIKGDFNDIYAKENENYVKTFFELVKYHNLKIKVHELQPDKDQYAIPLMKNAQLLKDYGGDFLKGDKW